MILLCTLNARYIHSSLGLRYLYANMGKLQEQTRVREFMINQRPIDIAEQILAERPRIVGFGLYIWNIVQTTEVTAILKALDPSLIIVAGGPEISHETAQSPASPHVDHVIRGQADFAFGELCEDLLAGNNRERIIDPPAFHPGELALPYELYNDEDIRQRVLYVEASRGCPFKCEFCLSALDKTAQPFDTESFLQAMEALYQRGARHFKFVDRTFNLNIATSSRILEFFLAKPLDDLFLHFELIPDRLPDKLKSLIQRFPAGCLQFEIGIQSFNPAVQANISRKQDHAKTLDNLVFLREQTGVHLHTDLIAGLPGEDWPSFARGFDLLVSLKPHEIQLGILKRLRGMPMIDKVNEFDMLFNPMPPYNILSTRDMDRDSLFRFSRFARYWDMIANSGRFTHCLPLLLGETPFDNFMALTNWLFAETGQTHRIALPRLFGLLYRFGIKIDGLTTALEADFALSGIKGGFLKAVSKQSPEATTASPAFSRQLKHLAM
jgi:radical SAM superfamily enzyme YgiQ (UPF0313 family)